MGFFDDPVQAAQALGFAGDATLQPIEFLRALLAHPEVMTTLVAEAHTNVEEEFFDNRPLTDEERLLAGRCLVAFARGFAGVPSTPPRALEITTALRRAAELVHGAADALDGSTDPMKLEARHQEARGFEALAFQIENS